MKTTILVLAAAVGLAACGDDTLTGPTDVRRVGALPEAGARGLVVMTRNVYPGVHIEDIMAAPVEQIPIAAAQAWGKLQLTNFPERAGALADEIVANAPHVVGLQEVPIYRIQSPGDAVVGGTVPATDVALDFLQILLGALEERGAHYVAVAVDRTTDVEVPAFAGFDANGAPTFMDIRFTDGDAILVRGDVGYANQASGRYQTYIPLELAGMPLGVYRGWGAVDATVGGTTYRFVNTHLEDMVTEVQVGQAFELIGRLAAETRPIVLTGDFNSDAFTSDTPTYGMLLEAGFADVWPQANPRERGATCCNGEMLDDPVPPDEKRLDFVLLRGGSVVAGRIVGGLHAALVGESLADRTASGLWPSDHAGVVALLETPGVLKER